MRAGDLIAGRYRVVRPAGSGAMGAIYEGHDVVSGEPVALKTLRGDVDADEKSRARLKYEAKALRGIAHRAVVRYVDHGVAANDEPFLVMEWVAGRTLADRLRTSVTAHQALGLVEHLASGLDAVHALGIVHRDLKPSNVMLRNGDLAQGVLVDFGVARVRRTTGGVRLTGDRLGTPRYMAPEQIRGARDVDGKADVFALGCIAFECITGRRAFAGPDAVTVLARILFEPPPAPSTVHARLAPFDAFVAAMMEHDPARRIDATSVVDRARDLRAAPASRPLVAEPSEAFSPLSAGTLPLHSTPQAPAFRGHEPACAALATLLARDDARVVSIACTDADHAAAIVAEALRRLGGGPNRPWDALVSVSLARARTVADAAWIVAAQAGVPLDGTLPPAEAVGAALARMGRVLLVVHAVDAIAGPLALVASAWITAAPRLRFLATSVERLALPGAIPLEIEPPAR